jgi:hypothetical protein
MAWSDALKKKKQIQDSPPSLEVINDGMIPKNVTPEVVTENYDYVPEHRPKRGRPKSSNNYNAHIHIKCPEELARKFKILSAVHGVHYAILLQQALDAFELVQDD